MMGQGYCTPCHAAYARENRPRHRELSEEARIKANTRAYTKMLVKRGKLEKKPCQKCGSLLSQASHPDYTNPWQVNWLCRPCRRNEHKHEHASEAPPKPLTMDAVLKRLASRTGS